MSDLAGRDLGPYRLLDQLGLGGMATVYRAYHAAMDRYVAIKVLSFQHAYDPLVRARFDQEARTIARLTHRHILPVHDIGEADGIPYLVMHYTTGGTLLNLIGTERLTLRHATRLAFQVGQALAYAHAHGVIHRDVKPANILLDRSGDALLTDFGIAKVIESTLQITGEHALVGTPAYMAPEQVLNEPVDGRTDVYALGIVLYEALTGILPFEAETPLALALMQIYNPPRPPHQLNERIPRRLEQIIIQALAKRPDDRFPSADAIVRALEAVLDQVADEPVALGQPSGNAGSVTQQLPELGNPRTGFRRAATVQIDRRRLRDALKALAAGRWADVLPLLEGMPLDDPNVVALRQEALKQLLVHNDQLERTTLVFEGAAPITPHLPASVAHLRIDLGDRAPYLGLHAFHAQDQALFFGRDATIQAMLEQAQRTPLLAVLGPSGSGKSSVVLAGLLPALHEGALPGWRWRSVVFRPGASPLDALAVALTSLRGGGLGDVKATVTRLRDDNQALLAPEILGLSADGERLALVVDQFEEFWTQAPRAAAAHRSPGQSQHAIFLRLLLQAAKAGLEDHGSPVLIVLTMRADFLHRAAEERELAPWISAHNVIVSPMGPDELRAAIVRPAQTAGGTFEPGLADALIDQVAGQPGGLPLLEYTLLELWKLRRAGVMTWDALRALGGVEGALAVRADSILEAHYTPETRGVLRQLLVRLVQPGEGAADTRRRMPLDDLVPAGGSADDVRALLAPFIDAWLVTTSRDSLTGVETLELSHEALIRAWPALRAWVREGRDDLRLQLQLEDAAREWHSSDKNPDLLWMGLRLGRAEDWALRSRAAINERTQHFLAASRAQEHLRVAAAEADRRERERLQIERLAEQRNATRLRRLLALAIGLLLLALFFAGSALISRQQAIRAQTTSQRLAGEAEQARANAQAIARAGEALIELDRRPERGLLLALSAVPTDTNALYPPMVARALYRAFDDVALRRSLPGHSGAVVAVAWRPDGQQFLTAGADSTLCIWDAASGRQIARLQRTAGPIRAAAWSPDGRRIITGGAGNAAQIWDAVSSRVVQTLEGHTASIEAVAWSPDGQQILTGSNDTTARVWDAATGTAVRVLQGHAEAVRAVAWSPSGQQILTGSNDHSAKVWDAATGAVVQTLSGHTAEVLAVAWSPDGRTVLTGSADATARVWEAASGTAVRVLNGHADTVYAVAWSPDGRSILTGSTDKTARVWDVQSGNTIQLLEGHTNWIYAAQWSPDGQFALTGSADKTARVWQIARAPNARVLHYNASWIPAAPLSTDGQRLVIGDANQRPLIIDVSTGSLLATLPSTDTAIQAAAWDTAGQRLALGGSDITIWDVPRTTQLRTLRAGGARVYAVAWSPDGRQILTGDASGAGTIWDATTGTILHTLRVQEGAIFTVAWSPDGKFALTGGVDGRGHIWNATTGAEILTLTGHTSYLYAARWSPDGRQILTGGADGVARIWDATTGAELRALSGHESSVYAVAWALGGKLVLTASADGTARIWDAISGSDLRALRGSGGTIVSADWSGDGKLVLTGATDGAVRQWIADPGMIVPELKRRACQLFGDAAIREIISAWRGCAIELQPSGTYDAFMAGAAATPTASPTAKPTATPTATPTSTATPTATPTPILPTTTARPRRAPTPAQRAATVAPEPATATPGPTVTPEPPTATPEPPTVTPEPTVESRPEPKPTPPPRRPTPSPRP